MIRPDTIVQYGPGLAQNLQPSLPRHRAHLGMSCSRSRWLPAWMLTASVDCRFAAASRAMALGTPGPHDDALRDCKGGSLLVFVGSAGAAACSGDVTSHTH